MDIPGYDEWKLRSPDEEHERLFGPLCPFCGASDPRYCDLEEETEGNCPWEMSEPDPDYLMELRREDERMERDNPRDWED